jgi:hypothetical protein
MAPQRRNQAAVPSLFLHHFRIPLIPLAATLALSIELCKAGNHRGGWPGSSHQPQRSKIHGEGSVDASLTNCTWPDISSVDSSR